MKAIVVDHHGGPEVLELREVASPIMGDGDILVSPEAAGVNFIDTYQREGIYDMDLPYTPGLEGAGVVEAIGANVQGISPGDTVAWCGSLGSYAEQIAISATKTVLVPEGVSALQAASVMLQGLTAHYLTTSVFEVKPGTTALVHAAAGGVGLLLCQMISQRGGTVLATVSTAEKEIAARNAGAAHVIRYDTEDVPAAVHKILGGTGVQVVYDGVGASTFQGSLDSLAPRGTLALFGQASGPVQVFDPQILNQKGSLILTRPSLGHFTQTPEELRWRALEVFASVASGQLKLAISGTYPLAEARTAHEDLQARKTSGKLLLALK